MRVAYHFRRPDVDAFLGELTHEQYRDWCVYFGVEPQGWQAVQVAVETVTYRAAQLHTRRKLKPRDFRVSFYQTDPALREEADRAKMEAWAIRTELREQLLKGLADGETD